MPHLAAPQVASSSFLRIGTDSQAHELPIVGLDPDVPSLFWCAGLAGAGMTTGVALGDLAGMAVLGARVPRSLAARRFSTAPRRRVRP